MKSIIQFPHPGGEHNDKSGKDWNTSNHKRKYLKVNGSYLQDLSSKPIKNTLYFWGEWEAQSHVTSIVGVIKPNYPRYIFTPYYKLPIGKVNTDPFVFGNQFYYCICKQGHYPILRDLDKGSLIIFGSNKNGNFVLDTLFVVKEYEEYKISDIKSLKKKYNKVFYDVSLAPIITTTEVKCKETIADKKTGICIPLICDDLNDNNPVKDIKRYRIYKALMYDDVKNTGGIFSYAPCLPEPFGKCGFVRPTINLPYISQSLNQGLKIIKGQKVEDAWNVITQQVFKQNLNLMIKTDIPISTNLKNQ